MDYKARLPGECHINYTTLKYKTLKNPLLCEVTLEASIILDQRPGMMQKGRHMEISRVFQTTSCLMTDCILKILVKFDTGDNL